MIPKIESWTIVIPGAWNVRIFSPEWLIKNLFEIGQQIQIEIKIDSGLIKGRFSTDRLILIPAEDKFIIGMKNTDDETLQMGEKVAQKLLDTLSHTPILGFGINFGFAEETPPPELTSLFQMNDLIKIGKIGAALKSTEITRKFLFNGNVINIRHNLDENNLYGIHLNFHYDIKSTEEARDKLLNIILPCRDIANNLLQQIYNLALEEVPTT